MREEERAILQHSTLFSGISPAECERLCALLGCIERHYARGSYLITAGDPIPAFALLLSGAVQVFMDDVDGNHIVMHLVTPGSTFAEAMVCSGVAEAPICAEAVQDSAVLWFRGEALMDPRFFSDPLCARFGTNFIRTLAGRSLRFNDRIQILSKKSIRDKLITFFSQQVHRQHSHQLVLQMDRSALADYLGVERSALSRELSRMRRAGLIDFRKNQFTIYHT